MKHLFKILFLIFSFCGIIGGSLGIAQTIPNPVVLYAQDSIKLMGKGDFGGSNSDQGKTYYYNLNVGTSYKFICRVNSHTGASSRGKVIAFLKDVNSANETDGNRPMHYVSAEAGQIAFYSRTSVGARTRKLASIYTGGVPSWLYIEIKGDSVIGKYSLASASTNINNIAWGLLAKFGNAFTGWTNIKKGVGVCSGSSSYSSAVISKFTVQPSGGVVTPTNIQGITDGQIIASWNAFGNIRTVKARIFAGKLWVTDASLPTDSYFFVRGGNFLNRADVTLSSSFSSTKIQYFEGSTAAGGLAPPSNFTTPAGYQLGTNTNISNDGTPYYEPLQTLPNCAGGFNLLSATQQTGQYKGEYIFNSMGASKHKWSLYNGTTLLTADTTTATSSKIVFNIPSNIASGSYTLKVDIRNCTGTDSRAFSYTKPSGGLISAPTITSNPAAIIGSNLALTATNCSFSLDWYRNNTFVTTSQSLSVLNAALNDIYSAKCRDGAVSSEFSNEIIVGSLGNDGGGVSTFVNVLKQVAIETQNDKFSVGSFPTIGTKLKNLDASRQVAKWPVIWHHKVSNFTAANKKTWDLGISSPTDIKPYLTNQEGDGVRCADYILYADPNTGQPWAGGNDPLCGNINTFVSTRPFQYRVKGEGGTALSMSGWSLERYYDEGFSYTRADIFGYGDNVGNKSNVAFAVTDVENGEHGRFEEIPIVIGMADNTMGTAISMYNQSINIVYPELSHYPLDYVNGGYRQYKVLLDGTDAYEEVNHVNVRIANNVINEAWKPENKVTITSRGINNKGLIDFPNALESSEISCYASAAYHQGDEIYYDNDNPALHRTINKFGLNRNAEHIIAHTIYGTQIRKWYLRKYFNDRHFYTLAKDLTDRDQVGNTGYGKFGNNYVDNTALRSSHLPRDLAFLQVMFTAFEGSYYYQWDRNSSDRKIDSKNGILAAINYLNQRKTMTQGNLSFVDLFDSFDYKLWTAEISYDGGTTWKQEKGTDYIMSQTSIPHAQCITSNGIWAVLLGRPENTENLTCKLRIMYNGSYRYLDVTADMWDTVDPAYANTALANLPNNKRSFYYNLIDLTSGTSVNAPSVNSSPANPIAGTSTTLTATGCSGTVKWWLTDANVATGASYTISNPVAGNSYFATCTVSGVTSVGSSFITISGNEVPVIVMVGESNAGSRNASSTALSNELGVRAGVRIWNNSTNTLQTIDIPNNSNLGENASISTGWGWELQLANLRANNTINKDIVIVKTAQGGALIGQYNTDISGGYWSILESRINGVKAALQAEGKVPKFTVLYSQGLNNAIPGNQSINDPSHFPGLSGTAYWQAATNTMFANLRTLMGANTKICMTKFWGSYGTYLNGTIDNIVNANTALNYSITTSDLTIQSDALHYDASSTKTIANRMATVFNNFQ